jgi:hypothetical protein
VTTVIKKVDFFVLSDTGFFLSSSLSNLVAIEVLVVVLSRF